MGRWPKWVKYCISEYCNGKKYEVKCRFLPMLNNLVLHKTFLNYSAYISKFNSNKVIQNLYFERIDKMKRNRVSLTLFLWKYNYKFLSEVICK